MSLNDATKFLKFANVQMAAESYFGLTPATAPLKAGATAFDEAALKKGNDRASVFSPTLAAQFVANWDVVEHIAITVNTKRNTKGQSHTTPRVRVKLFCAALT